MVRTLNLYGCLVKTDKRFHLGAKIALRITDAGTQFSAKARIANQASDGFGVEFTELSAADKAQLETCLEELADRDEVSLKKPGGVLIVDDHHVTRNTVRSILQGHRLRVCGEAENGK